MSRIESRAITSQMMSRMAATYATCYGREAASRMEWQDKARNHSWAAQVNITMALHGMTKDEAALWIAIH